MPQGKPRSGEFYRHFKERLYQVLTIAKYSETGEELVVYQALYGDYQVYARPLAMFISEVDRKAYPDAGQRYRFQLVEPDGSWSWQAPLPEAPKEPDVSGAKTEEAKEQDLSEKGMSGRQNRTEPEKKDISELLMDFYDAETCEEKYEILTAMQKDITDVMIDNMAVVLDVVIPEGELYKRYDELRTCLKTRQRYEIRRS